MAALVLNRAGAASMGAAARAKTEAEFALDDTVHRYEALYPHVASSQGTVRGEL
jgi:hypothetical protein